jgi:hypothetical protein
MARFVRWRSCFLENQRQTRKHMNTQSIFILPALLVGCAASFPPPTQHLADAESAQRSARELGAANQPTAQLHLKLADEQMALAKKEMASGDNRSADFALGRARADSELALALAREQNAAGDVTRAVDTSNATATTNAAQGAVK